MDEEGDEEEEEAEEEEYEEEEEEDEYAEDDNELEAAEEEDYYEDETEAPTTQPPTTTTTTKLTTTTTKPTTTTSTTTTTVDPRKSLEPRILELLNGLSSLQTKVNEAAVQDQTCKEKISSDLVAYLASRVQLDTNLYKDPYSKNLNILTALEGNLKDVSEEWAECLVRTTTTTSTSTTTTTEEPTTTTTQTTTSTTTEEPTTTTEEPTTSTSTTTEAATTESEEKMLMESLPEFTIDPPKEEYAREPDSAQDDEINQKILEEIKRAEDMIEKQKQSIIIPPILPPIIDEPETPAAPTTEVPTTVAAITTKKVVVTTTTVHPHKHMLRPRFKGLKAIRDKPPAICNQSMDLYHASRYAKSVCVIHQNVSYDEAHEICAREEMDLFAIQSMDHHLVCRLQLHHLFKTVPSYWINGRHINDLWYYFHSENNGQKRFIYPGTQFDGPHSGSCLRLMIFTGHNVHIAANAADCNLELPFFCEYYIEQ
jgi:hypothetical protein